MRVVYVETSALLGWLLGEPTGATARECIDLAETCVTSVLTPVETSRVLARAEQESVLTSKEAQALRGLMRRILAGWMHMELTEAVRARASRTFPTEPVRTLDAIHLATCLEFAEAFPEIELLSFDHRMRANAELLGVPLAG